MFGMGERSSHPWERRHPAGTMMSLVSLLMPEEPQPAHLANFMLGICDSQCSTSIMRVNGLIIVPAGCRRSQEFEERAVTACHR
jgi:hypothetical protein